jgi:translation initiation factor 1A
MPKNTGKGGNKRKKGKKPVQEDRELRFANESEEYAQITKILGDGRFQCKCSDGIERIAHVRGKMRKRVWLANGDIILVSLREFEPEKCDVVEKYKDKELTKLKSNGEIPDSFILPSSNDEKENIDEGDIKFEEEEKVVVKKKEDLNGFEIESDEENEDDESEEKKENENNEKKKKKKMKKKRKKKKKKLRKRKIKKIKKIKIEK